MRNGLNLNYELKRGCVNVFKKFKQRGQVVFFYAFFIPLLFFFVGTIFDLSWYFVNVSRMQNAADAAVIAGAQTLIGEDGNLYYYVDKTFVKGYDPQSVSEFYQDTTLGDTIAKTYVRKNLGRISSDWDDDIIIDSWTKNELYFESILLGDKKDNFETLYYHVMLEEDVPHMFLNGWFDTMNAKVSSVVKISQYMKGYDFFEQMKYLGYKHKRLALNAKDERTITPDTSDTDERFNFTEDDSDKNFFDSLFTGYVRDTATANVNNQSDGDIISGGTFKKNKLKRRVININTVYPIRDYGFYYNYNALQKIRDKNSAYDNLNDDDLASALAKDSDPLYIVIESEKDSPQQLIININRSNTNEFSDRPIIFVYDAPEDFSHYPVILNLNADFRGALYAPNNPVVINGNEHDFEGFVIAESYAEFIPDDDAYYNYYDYNSIQEEFVDDYGDTQYGKAIPVDDYGDVLYKMNYDGSYETIKPVLETNNEISFDKEKFNFSSSVFDSLNIVKLENHSETFPTSDTINNLFLQPPPNQTK